MLISRKILLITAALCVSQIAFAAAPSYLVVDSQSGYILLDQNGREKRQIGSLTKIASACVVLDWAEKRGGDLNQNAQITQQSFVGVEKNEIGWQAGDSASLRDLLYAALVQSDNVAANALAESVGQQITSLSPASASGKFSSTSAFVAQMNALAQNLKMERTRFVNPTGFDFKERPMPYSTAFDLARLTRYAVSKASFRFYVSQKTREIAINRGGKPTRYMLRSTNDLLGTNGIDGVKTGQTARAGECLILSANREAEITKNGATTEIYPRHLLIVILGSSDRFGDGDRLVRTGWQAFDKWSASGRLLDQKKTL